MKKLILSMVFLSCMYVNTAYAQYDQSLAPPGYVLMQCEWNYGTQWFMKVYYWPAADHYIYRFHFFCERLGTNTRDDNAGDSPGGASPPYTDQEAYPGSPGESPSQQDAEPAGGGSGYSGDIGGESNCCGANESSFE